MTVVLMAAGLALGPQAAGEARADTLGTALELAAPLGERFGVSTDQLKPLLEDGVSLDSVTQLLLVKEDSGKEFSEVSEKYTEGGKDVDAVASDLGVDSSAYSEDKVDSVLADAKKSLADGATKKATGAIGGLLGK